MENVNVVDTADLITDRLYEELTGHRRRDDVLSTVDNVMEEASAGMIGAVLGVGVVALTELGSARGNLFTAMAAAAAGGSAIYVARGLVNNTDSITGGIVCSIAAMNVAKVGANAARFYVTSPEGM